MDNKEKSVGESTMEWAEKAWGLDQACKNKRTDGGEPFSYRIFREAMINQINGLIRARIFPEHQLLKKSEAEKNAIRKQIY